MGNYFSKTNDLYFPKLQIQTNGFIKSFNIDNCSMD